MRKYYLYILLLLLAVLLMLFFFFRFAVPRLPFSNAGEYGASLYFPRTGGLKQRQPRKS